MKNKCWVQKNIHINTDRSYALRILLFFVYLYMLLQLENTSPDNIKKLLAFASQNQLHLSLIDDMEENFSLPGKELTPQQLNQIIETSRKSGMISMQNAHQSIRSNYNAD